MENKEKIILDVCCGGRMFWFDKNNPNVLFLDKRTVDPVSVGKGRNARMFKCKPDKIMDFTNLKIPDKSFSLVVFDPPHFTRAGNGSYMGMKYGVLDKDWRQQISKGFKECFRVLKNNGVLIFKWNEYDVRLREILALTPVKPLFGHPSGKMQKTHWVCFMKIDDKLNEKIKAH